MNRRSFFTKLAVGAAAAPQLAKAVAETPKPKVLVPFCGCTGTWDFVGTENSIIHEGNFTPLPPLPSAKAPRMGPWSPLPTRPVCEYQFIR